MTDITSDIITRASKAALPPKSLFANAVQETVSNSEIYSRLNPKLHYGADLLYFLRERGVTLQAYDKFINRQEIDLITPFLLLYCSTPYCFNSTRYPERSRFFSQLTATTTGIETVLLLEAPLKNKNSEERISFREETGVRKHYATTRQGILAASSELNSGWRRHIDESFIDTKPYLQMGARRKIASCFLQALSGMSNEEIFQRLAVDSVRLFSPLTKLAFYETLTARVKTDLLETIKDKKVRDFMADIGLNPFSEVPIDITDCGFCGDYHEGNMRLCGEDVIFRCGGETRILDSASSFRFKKSLLPTLLVNYGAIPILTERANTAQQIKLCEFLYGHNGIIQVTPNLILDNPCNAYQYNPSEECMTDDGLRKTAKLTFRSIDDDSLSCGVRELIREIDILRRENKWAEADNERLCLLLEEDVELQWRPEGVFFRQHD